MVSAFKRHGWVACRPVVFLLFVHCYFVSATYEPYLWPMPQKVALGNTTVEVNPAIFKFGCDESPCHEILKENFAYYNKTIFSFSSNKRHYRHYKKPKGLPQLTNLQVSVGYPDLDELQLGVDESYTLFVRPPTARIESITIYGAVRGLETFSQLFHMTGPDYIIHNTSVLIEDWPRFPWRGLMMDVSRHFFPVSYLKGIIDQMAQNKLNALHMHLTDGECFPVEIKQYPLLAANGAWTPDAIYRQDDLRELVRYAKTRGIRVIPEIDMPAHAASWALGYPEIQTVCPKFKLNVYYKYYWPMNPTINLTYEIVNAVIEEMSAIFPDKFFHIGGDETHYTCWDQNEQVTAWRKAMNFTDDELFQYFEKKIQNMVYAQKKTPIGWDEVFFSGGPATPGLAVEVWNSPSLLDKVIKQGYPAILSKPWYMNNGGDWTKYYSLDPLSYLSDPTPEQEQLVMGCEACMWDAHFDTYSVGPMLWPNVAAAAERFWSDQSVTDVTTARTRLNGQRCRLARRGAMPYPIAQDYCDQNVYVRQSHVYDYPDVPPADKLRGI